MSKQENKNEYGFYLQAYYKVLKIKEINDTKLSSTDKLVWLIIHNLDKCEGEPYCWASNKYIGEILGLSKDTVSKSIKKLGSLNLIKSVIQNVNKRTLKSHLSKEQPKDNTDTPKGESDTSLRENQIPNKDSSDTVPELPLSNRLAKRITNTIHEDNIVVDKFNVHPETECLDIPPTPDITILEEEVADKEFELMESQEVELTKKLKRNVHRQLLTEHDEN